MSEYWTRRRVADGAVAVLALAATELGRGYYRPFIRAHGLDDFHVADTLGNSVGTIAAAFAALAVFGRGEPRDVRLLTVATVSVFAYELAHPLLGRPIDPWDLLATVLAGGAAALIFRLVRRDEESGDGAATDRGPSADA